MKYSRLINIKHDELPLMPEENLIWKGKPKKGYFILSNSIVMMPIALIWIIFDGFLIGTILSQMTDEVKMMAPFLGLFFALHLIPVWVWFSNIREASKDWNNTEYLITDKRVIIKNGLYSGKSEAIYYKNIVDVDLCVGAIDKTFGVGDIYLKTKHGTAAIMDIKESKEIYDKLQKIVKETQKEMSIVNTYKKKNENKDDTEETKK